MKEYVTKPLETDIFSSRGRNAFRHAGNERFRRVIVSHIERYKSATMRTEKSAIVEEAFKEILGYGGRFLKKDWDNNKQWYVLEKKEARSKVAHTLRDCVTDRIKSIWAAKDGTTVEWADPPRPVWKSGSNGQRRRKRGPAKKKTKKASTAEKEVEKEKEGLFSTACRPSTDDSDKSEETTAEKRRRRLPARKRYVEEQQLEQQHEQQQQQLERQQIQEQQQQQQQNVEAGLKPTPQFLSHAAAVVAGVAARCADVNHRGLDQLKGIQPANAPAPFASGHVSSTATGRTLPPLDEDDVWCTMFVRLIQFRAKFGHVQVPPDYEPDPELAFWVEVQRMEQRKYDRGLPSKMTKPRLDKLGALKFVWTTTEDGDEGGELGITWNARFMQIRRHWRKHGQNMWTVEPFREDKELLQWVDRQTEELAKINQGFLSSVISDERMLLLEKVNFPGAIQSTGKPSRDTAERKGEDVNERPAAHLLLQALRGGPSPSISKPATDIECSKLPKPPDLSSSSAADVTPPDNQPVVQTGLGARHRRSIEDAMLLAQLNQYGIAQKKLAQEKAAGRNSLRNNKEDKRDDSTDDEKSKQAVPEEEEGPSFWHVAARSPSKEAAMKKGKSEVTTSATAAHMFVAGATAEQQDRRPFPWRNNTSPVPQALPYH